MIYFAQFRRYTGPSHEPFVLIKDSLRSYHSADAVSAAHQPGKYAATDAAGHAGLLIIWGYLGAKEDVELLLAEYGDSVDDLCDFASWLVNAAHATEDEVGEICQAVAATT